MPKVAHEVSRLRQPNLNANTKRMDLCGHTSGTFGIVRTFDPALPGEIACVLLLQPSPSCPGPRGILGGSVHRDPIILALLEIPFCIVGKCNLWQSFFGALGSRVLRGDFCSFLYRRCSLSSGMRKIGLRHSLLEYSLQLVSKWSMKAVAGGWDRPKFVAQKAVANHLQAVT